MEKLQKKKGIQTHKPEDPCKTSLKTGNWKFLASSNPLQIS